MTLALRNGIYHWKKMVNGHLFARTTKTGDLKTAQTLATIWEAECIRQVMLSGNKPMYLHDVLDAFLRQREGRAGSLLGHRKISSTMVYAHIEHGAVATRAAEVLSGRA